MTTRNTTRTVTTYPDGSINVKVTDTRTPEEKLSGMPTFAERLDAMFPTTEAEITKGWAEFDDHKRLK